MPKLLLFPELKEEEKKKTVIDPQLDINYCVCSFIYGKNFFVFKWGTVLIDSLEFILTETNFAI